MQDVDAFFPTTRMQEFLNEGALGTLSRKSFGSALKTMWMWPC
jgi:hypothetical protein